MTAFLPLLVLAVVVTVSLTGKHVTGELWFCAPSLWEGKRWTLRITHTDQGVDVSENTADFSVDTVGQRIASNETGVRNGQQYNVYSLYYYPANTLYTVSDGLCESHHISGNFSLHCIDYNDTMVELVHEYMGFYDWGNWTRTLCTWTYGVRGVENGVGYFQTVDIANRYLPLVEEKHGVINGVPTYTVTNFYNVTEGIEDPGVFTPPDICIKEIETSSDQ